MSSEKDKAVKDAPEKTDPDAESVEVVSENGAEVADSEVASESEAEIADSEVASESDTEIAEPDVEEWVVKPDAGSDAASPDIAESKGPQKMAPSALIIGLVIAVGVAAFFAGTYVTGMNTSYVSEEYIDEAIAKLELKLLQNRLPTQPPPPSPTQPPPTPLVRPSADNDPIIGSPDAPIEIIEFSDFQCPFCARFYEQTLPLLIDEYIAPGKAKLVFRDFPLQSIHPNAAAAALAAECANEQDKFKGMHDILFERQREWGSQSTVAALGLFSQYAAEIEAEQTAFDECIASQRHLQEIGKDLSDGQSYGITGTPGFFVGNEQIGYVEIKGAQPYEVFKQIIDAQLGA